MHSISIVQNYLKLKNKIKSTKIGDIIWIKRYDNEIEKEKIEIGHREGPAIVIHKNLFNTYILSCTSEVKNSKAINLFYLLKKDKYKKLKKDTYVKIFFIQKLKPKNYVFKIHYLQDDDLNQLNKKVVLYFTQNKSKILNYFLIKRLKFILTDGDIIKYNNQLYYIYEHDNQYFYCYQVEYKNKGYNAIDINDITYFFNFKVKVKILINKKIKLINTCNDIKKLSIKVKNEEYQKSKKTKNFVKHGHLIKYENNLFYVYGEFSNYYLLYKVYRDIEKNDDMLAIAINKGIYFTSFEQVRLNKNEQFEIRRIANDIEIKNIKYLYKNHKINLENKNLIVHKKIQEKTIIATFDSLDRYVVIKRIGNTIRYIDLDDYNNIYEEKIDSDFAMRKIGVIDNFEFQNIKAYLKNHHANYKINKIG